MSTDYNVVSSQNGPATPLCISITVTISPIVRHDLAITDMFSGEYGAFVTSTPSLLGSGISYLRILSYPFETEMVSIHIALSSSTE